LSTLVGTPQESEQERAELIAKYTALGDKLDRLLRHDGGKRRELSADAEAARAAVAAAVEVRSLTLARSIADDLSCRGPGGGCDSINNTQPASSGRLLHNLRGMQ
jgi:hypothetical protein